MCFLYPTIANIIIVALLVLAYRDCVSGHWPIVDSVRFMYVTCNNVSKTCQEELRFAAKND